MMLMIGASARAMVASAVQAGFSVQGLDFFGDLDANLGAKTYGLAEDFQLAPSVYNLFRAAEDLAWGKGLLYLSGPENHPSLLARWRDRGLLLGNGPETLELVRDPFWLRRVLEGASIHMPEFFPLEDAPDALDGPYLLKPLHRGGGHGIVPLPQGTGWRQAARRARRHPHRYLVQRRCLGESGSFTFLANGKKALLVGTSSQWPVEGGFDYCGNMAPMDPAFLTPGILAQMERAASLLTKAAGLVGLNTVDVMVDPQGRMWVLEVNPRWSASVELFEMLAGASLFPCHLQGCRGEMTPVSAGGPGKFAGKAIVYARRDLMVRYPHPGAWLSLYDSGIRDLPRPGALIQTGQPLCTVLALDATASRCRDALARQESRATDYFLQHAQATTREG